MGIIIAVSRYLLPVLTLIILIKCMLPLILGHPKEKVYGYIIDLADGESYPLNMWETSVGRSNSCDIVIGYDTVSRFQAVISRRIDGWYIYDLLSKSGIKINDEKVEKKATIKNGDVLTFGIMQYRFMVANDPVVRVGKSKSGKKAKKQPLPKPQVQSNNTGNDTSAYNDNPYRNYSGMPEEKFDLNFRKYEADRAGRNDSIYSSRDTFVVETPSARSEQPFYTYKTNNPAIVNRDSGEVFMLCGNYVSIGRNRTNDIKLMSPTVSRHHADIVLYEDGWAIVDANSAAGTYLNGKKISQPQLLFEGDVIGISDERLYYTAR